ncbi:MAG: DUF4390 domain-containing protein [Chitinivibrionales bacterium]|nr:DUF4390 domain-containing protein [Chitinivibrionales bacterium]
MNFIIGLLIAAKGIVLFSGIFALSKSNAQLGQPELILSASEIRLSTQIQNAFSKDLKKLANSGTRILIYLFIETREARGDRVVHKVVQSRELLYDLVDKQYAIVRNEIDTTTLATIDAAMIASTTFHNIAVAPVDIIDAQKRYYFVAYGVLGKTTVEALEGKELDLMYFWNYRRPTIRTQRFDGSRFRIED